MIEKKLKIAFFSSVNLENGGGLEKYFIETAASLSNSFNCDVHIICPGDSLIYKFGIPQALLRLKKPKWPQNAESTKNVKAKLGKAEYVRLETIGELKTKLREYDVIYSRNEIAEAVLFKFFFKFAELPPVIFGCHTSIRYEYKISSTEALHNILYNLWPYPWLIKGVSGFHVLNAYDAERLKKIKPTAKTQVIYPAFATKLPVSEKSKSNEKTTIMWVGKLSLLKGVEDLKTIIRQINYSHESQIKWVICGDGTERATILELTRKWRNVEYHGYVPNSEISNQFLQADLFLSTSKVETFGYTIIEALAHGLFVVGYSVAGLREIVESEKNGYLVTTKDQLISALENNLAYRRRVSFENQAILKKLEPTTISYEFFNFLSKSAMGINEKQ